MRDKTKTATAGTALLLALAGCGGGAEPQPQAQPAATGATAVTSSASATAVTTTQQPPAQPSAPSTPPTSGAPATGSSPDPLLRDGTQAATGVGETHSMPYTVDLGFKVSTKQRETLQVLVNTATLVTQVDLDDGQQAGARLGRMVLVAEVKQGGSGSATIPAERWRLTHAGAPAGGAPALVRTEPGFGTGVLQLTFDVPADLTTATLTAAPGQQLEGTSTNDFGRGRVTFPLTFPA